ncbi:DUF2218 domain-containing protein [Pseudomonas sp. UL073]|uniref:DUF2218 domain-containing protein n=1 Tax=Zestomonas insulae TaxID=2809017 RepID=A0ABS2IIG1_9GAMM|nr:DUF2218 domain-containing protein [Pseudomonas insulae]MBM7062844.1 DUF2218 domain-containing protein [Pseudomonas insulae]
MTLIASTHVTTATPGRYIGRLCKHFAHKLEVQHDEQQGHIDFAFGRCQLNAEADGLTLRVESANRADLEKLQHVVASHFERFAWQEALQLEWH